MKKKICDNCIKLKEKIIELEKLNEEMRASKLESKQHSNEMNQSLETENASQDIENQVNVERQDKLVLKVEELEKKLSEKNKA